MSMFFLADQTEKREMLLRAVEQVRGTLASRLRILVLCFLCAFGLIAGWTLKSQSGVPAWPNPSNGRPFPPGWFGGVIPYVLDEDLPDWGRREAETAMAAWTDMTVLKFVPRTDEPDFIYFVEDGQYQNCVRQPTCVGFGRFTPNNVHGVGHGLGLEHEQQRRDRDHYMRVFQERISPHYRWTWNPRAYYGADISPFNYQSVMHYGFMSSKLNRRGGPLQAETIPPHMPVGQTTYQGLGRQTIHITPGDADTVARMVGLTPESWTVSTNPLGLAVIVDGEEVTTPAVFDWTPDSEHTLSVPSSQARPGSRYRFGRWSDASATNPRTVIATPDTTLYEANFVAAHRISTRVYPEGAGTVTIRPGSADGYYPLRSEVTMSAEPTAGSGFRFLRWEISSDYLWQFLVTHETHGISANPARTYAMPGLEYTAIFGRGPIFRVESNTNPVTVEINGREYRTPISLEARSLPERMTVALGKDFLENDKGYRDRFRSWSDGGDEVHTVTVSRTEDTILELTVDTERRLVTEAWQAWHGNQIRATPSSEDGFYPEGTEVRLRAVAKPPAKFIGWNGDISGRDSTALVVMDDGKLAEAVFALEATELQPGVPVEVSLHWNASDHDFGRRYYVQVPPEASELEVQFRTRVVKPGAEAGLFLSSQDIWPDWVQHENAHRILSDGVETITVPRPVDGWRAAYFILVQGAESTGRETQTLEGTLVARVNEIAGTTPDPDFCVTRTCGVGQGDCDPGQCADGLVCAPDVGPQYGLPAIYDVCELPGGSSTPDPDLCRDYGPCGVGQGDCDPGQCGAGLVCAADVGSQYGLPAIYDVCEVPNDTLTQTPDPHFCASGGPNYPCEAGEGDCDPGQCAAGLVCATDVGPQYGLPADYDVCELP